MKKKLLLLSLCLFCLTGCNKFKGTWCRYVETYSTMIITSKNVTDSQLNKIKDTVSKLENLKSYDYMEDIEKANVTITIYYTSNESLSKSEELLSNLEGVETVENKSFVTPTEKLDISKNTYVYGYNLDNKSAFEESGSFTVDNNQITLTESQKTFYYKDKFLCNNQDCSEFLKKSKTNSCTE